MDIDQKIIQFINSIADRASPVSPEEDLLDSGVLDSLAMLQLVEFISAEFGVEIDPDAITPENFATVATVTRLVQSHGK
ncbi:MAG: acyl carrier protein [Gammaproteobacteria bacterium]|nr:acyl carrier protein [Gammaproteobacteria bacterium]